MDWAAAEELALGVDPRRRHRHPASPARTSSAAPSATATRCYHDAVTGDASSCRCSRSRSARAAFEIYNSPLTENASIGFEFGYNIQEPSRLVLWEAQYGDFINGAQVILDEFLTSGRAKWGLAPSLVLLLPHGYEGQGPDHSSARLERFLQPAADTTCASPTARRPRSTSTCCGGRRCCSTTDPLPLIVMTPKSLLRHPLVASTPRELAEGRFQPVIDDAGGQRSRPRCAGWCCAAARSTWT